MGPPGLPGPHGPKVCQDGQISQQAGCLGGGGQLRVLGAFHPSAVFQGPQGLQGRRGPPGLGGMQVNDVRVLSCIAEVHTCEMGKELLSPIPACFSAGSGWDGGVLRSQRRRCKNFFPTFGLWWGCKLGSRASLQGAPSPGGCAAFWLYKHRAGVADAGVPLAGHRGGPWNEGTTRTGGTCGESMGVNDRVGGGAHPHLEAPLKHCGVMPRNPNPPTTPTSRVLSALCFLTHVLCLSPKGFIGLPGSKGVQGERVSDGTHTMHGSGDGKVTIKWPKAPVPSAHPHLGLTLE